VILESDLAQLLNASELDAAPACLAVLRRGAIVASSPEGSTPVPVAELRTIFERRVRHLRSLGRAPLGGDQLVQALRSTKEETMQVLAVNSPDPRMHFALFLSADFSDLVACLGVDQTDNPNFYTASDAEPHA
jgi:hypothetical protein